MKQKKETLDDVKNYEELILTFFKSYGRKHKKFKDREALVNAILQGKSIDLPLYLKEVDKTVLRKELAKIIIKRNQEETSLDKKKNLLTYFFGSSNSLSNISFINKPAAAAFIAASILTISGFSSDKMEDHRNLSKTVSSASISVQNLSVHFANISAKKSYALKENSNLIKNQVTLTVEKKEEQTNNDQKDQSKTTPEKTPAPVKRISNISPKREEESSNELNEMLDVIEKKESGKEEKSNQKRQSEKEEKEIEKEKILNNFSKCKTLSSILKRQKELESLGLTKKDKLYKNCKLSAPLQRFIYEQSVSWGIVPTDFTFAIIDVETRGGFGSSGSKSVNNRREDDYDLGLTQQNTKSSVTSFAKAYHISYKKACKYIQYNDYVNIVSACLEYQEIARFNDNKFNPTQYAGCYNGWLKWRLKLISRQYVELFNNAYQNKYTKYHKIEKKKTTKNKIKVKTR